MLDTKVCFNSLALLSQFSYLSVLVWKTCGEIEQLTFPFYFYSSIPEQWHHLLHAGRFIFSQQMIQQMMPFVAWDGVKLLTIV